MGQISLDSISRTYRNNVFYHKVVDNLCSKFPESGFSVLSGLLNFAKRIGVFLATFVSALIITAAGVFAEEIRVNVENIDNDQGNIRIALYSSVENYKNENSTFTATVKASRGEKKITINDVKFGDYIIVLHHDENANGKLDRNLLGIPKEGYGFSNNPSSKFGPPDIEEAKFTLNKGTNIELNIEIQY